MAYLRFYTEIFILCKMTKMKKKSSTQEGLKSRSRGDNVFCYRTGNGQTEVTNENAS